MKIYSESELKSYIRKINHEIDFFFEIYSAKSKKFPLILPEVIIKSFHLPGWKLSKEIKALWILERVLLKTSQVLGTSFSLISFIKRHQINQRITKKISITLLYHIYFQGIQFAKLKKTDETQWLLIQIISEVIPQSKLQAILKTMTIDQQIHLLAFMYKNYREGSYFVLRALKAVHMGRKSLQAANTSSRIFLDLILGLKRNVFSLDVFLKHVNETSYIGNAKLNELLTRLKKHAQKEIRKCFIVFNKLIPLIINSPIETYNIFKKLNNQLKDEQIYNANETALTQRKKLQEVFNNYFDKKYNLKDFEILITEIGLYGQFPYIHIGGNQFLTSGLKDKIELIYEVFKNPFSIMRLSPSETLHCISFALTFIFHLEALSKNPEAVRYGVNKLACATASYGKDLKKHSAVESILEGLCSLVLFLKPSLNGQLSLIDFPIYIFDQSDNKLFKKNQKYLNRINKLYTSSIFHISYRQAIDLSKKLGIEKLIRISDREYMGYGGSRNCVFLLTPLLKHLFQIGKKKLSKILEMDKKLLVRLFQQYVLNNAAKHGNMILMIDDDMEIPEANIFSHALFAKQCENEYLYAHGYCVGRITKYLNKFRNLQDILNNPSDIFDNTQWVDIPFSVKMGEYIGKPKICLNLPLGQEEAHLQIKCVENPLLQVSRHLGGARYPSVGRIPSHFLIGLESYLKKNIPYVLGISLSMDLIDPSNIENRSILSWNEKIVRQFKCLKDAFLYIGEKKNMHEMQKRFWINVLNIFDPIRGVSIPLRQYVDELISMDVDLIIKKFKDTHSLDRSENKSLLAIGHLYKFHQKDALLFWEFGTSLISLKLFNKGIDLGKDIERIKINMEKKYAIHFLDYPTTYNFFLMCQSLGAGKFSSIFLENYALR